MSHTVPPDYETLATLLVDTAHLPEEDRSSSFDIASQFIEEETGSRLAGDIQRFTLKAMARATEFLEPEPSFKTEEERQAAYSKAGVKAVAVGLEEALGADIIEEAPMIAQEVNLHPKPRKAKRRSNFTRTLARERRVRGSLRNEKITDDMSDGWEEFRSGDLILRPEVHHRGRYVDIRLSTNASRKEYGHGRDLMIKYTISDEDETRVRLAGLDVPEDMREQGFGLGLYKYFRSGLEAKGLIFDGTEVVRKPSIARLMLKAGLKPESTKIVAEILPKEIWADKNIPSVVIRKGQEQERYKHRESNSGNFRFYDVVEAGDIPVDIDRVVPLHTRWIERTAQPIPHTNVTRS